MVGINEHPYCIKVDFKNGWVPGRLLRRFFWYLENDRFFQVKMHIVNKDDNLKSAFNHRFFKHEDWYAFFYNVHFEFMDPTSGFYYGGCKLTFRTSKPEMVDDFIEWVMEYGACGFSVWWDPKDN